MSDFQAKDYVWLTDDRTGDAEMVRVTQNVGPIRFGSSVDLISVRYLMGETDTVVRSTALSVEHPKAIAANLVRHAAGR